MQYYRDYQLAKDEADRRARRHTKNYYVAQDARRPFQHFAIVTRLQLLKFKFLLPATYVAVPENQYGLRRE